ncbi:MAG: class I SAM-dependent methyltransferase [Brevibacterium sp.]
MPEFADSSRARAETPAERHSRWSWIHNTAAMTGWDFSALSDRLHTDDPPWDFDLLCRSAMLESTNCLDMGTGGGERLIRLIRALRASTGSDSDAIPLIHATEGWEDNLPVATSALKEFGVEVSEYDSESGDRLPWDDGELDLVMNRHESYDIAEVVRVLAPGGIFLTQQVDSTEAAEFRDWFGGEPDSDTQLDLCIDEAERYGLTIDAARRWQGTMKFTDVEAVLEYLAYIPWDVPGFTVKDNLGALERLAAKSGPITVTQKRFLLATTKGDTAKG